jgi:hypothetical protein
MTRRCGRFANGLRRQAHRNGFDRPAGLSAENVGGNIPNTVHIVPKVVCVSGDEALCAVTSTVRLTPCVSRHVTLHVRTAISGR